MTLRFFRRAAAAIALVAAGAATAGAQVGYTPQQSPYRDLEYHQELTGFAGYFAAARDRAGVTPRSAPLVGALYEVAVGGPAAVYVRGARTFSNRDVIDPTKPAASRQRGSVSAPVYLADVGLAVKLTGQKSLYHFVPVLSGGFGVASDPGAKADVGGYRFGTSFAFSFGAGLRYAPGGRFQLRADVNDYIYQVQFPDSYFALASDNTAVLGPTDARSQYRHNAALTVGASYLFFR